jgi:hypothetical protein
MIFGVFRYTTCNLFPLGFYDFIQHPISKHPKKMRCFNVITTQTNKTGKVDVP